MTDPIAALRTELQALHRELVRNELAAWTSGNLSARVPGDDLVLIKPSGVEYGELTAADLVLVDLDGAVVEGDLAPSSDTLTHCFVYRSLPTVGGIAHTHSPFATAWAARGEPIPCALTAMADEFGGPIPVGPFASIGDEEIGVGIVATLQGQRSPAVLMRNHGVFTVGASPRAALKAAVMCEDVARTMHLARALGPVAPLADPVVDALHRRYQTAYGQK